MDTAIDFQVITAQPITAPDLEQLAQLRDAARAEMLEAWKSQSVTTVAEHYSREGAKAAIDQALIAQQVYASMCTLYNHALQMAAASNPMIASAALFIGRLGGTAVKVDVKSGRGKYAFSGEGKFQRVRDVIHYLRLCGVPYLLDTNGWNGVAVTI